MPSSKATAFLGKVPKESLEKWLKDQVGTEMPRYTDYPTDIGPISKRKAKDFLDKWTEKVKVINSAFPTGNDILKLNDFVDSNEELSMFANELINIQKGKDFPKKSILLILPIIFGSDSKISIFFEKHKFEINNINIIFFNTSPLKFYYKIL